MRTVFDTEDQSMMARFENQKALNAYMDEMPFGIGMGAIDGVVPPHNKYYFVSICPSDSSLVDVWKQMGIVGLCVFLGMHAILFLSGSYILLFKIRNLETGTADRYVMRLCRHTGSFLRQYGLFPVS